MSRGLPRGVVSLGSGCSGATQGVKISGSAVGVMSMAGSVVETVGMVFHPCEGAFKCFFEGFFTPDSFEFVDYNPRAGVVVPVTMPFVCAVRMVFVNGEPLVGVVVGPFVFESECLTVVRVYFEYAPVLDGIGRE